MRKTNRKKWFGIMGLLLGVFFLMHNVEVTEADDVEINEDTFPDEIFREWVVANCDTSKDGKLSDDELDGVTEIEIAPRYEGISDLQGIEYFTKLEKLRCNGILITKLDVSKNTALIELECGDNRLSELNVSSNTLLKGLRCYSSGITKLDVSKNTALTELMCSNNQITELNLSNNTALTRLECNCNAITELGLNNNTALTYLDCSWNQLEGLNVRNNTLLENLSCSKNYFTTVDITDLTALSDTDGTINGNVLTVEASKRDISNAQIEDVVNKTYTGNPITQNPTVKLGDKTLVVGTDYELSYNNDHTNVGKATVTITGKGNYTGSVSKDFKITAKNITPAVTLSATSYVYNGTVRKPSVVVKAGTTKLTTASYKVTYSDGLKNVGTYSVKVTLKGNYSGTKTVKFTIVPKGTSISKLTPAKKGFTVKWTKQAAQTTGYQIQYSTSSTFKSGNKTVTVKGVNNVSKAISKLASGKKYYVRIRTYKTVGSKNYFSAWSKVKAVKTK